MIIIFHLNCVCVGMWTTGVEGRWVKFDNSFVLSGATEKIKLKISWFCGIGQNLIIDNCHTFRTFLSWSKCPVSPPSNWYMQPVFKMFKDLKKKLNSHFIIWPPYNTRTTQCRTCPSGAFIMHSIFCFPYCIVGAVHSQRAPYEQISPATRIRSIRWIHIFYLYATI